MDSWTVWTDEQASLERLGWEGLSALEGAVLWPRALGPLADAAGAVKPLRPWWVPCPLPGWDWVLAVEESRGSQFDLLRQLSSDTRDRLGSVACLALSGQGFHGQHGRNWEARSGNLHLSLLCPVELDAASCHAPLMMLPAVASLNAVRQVLNGHPAAAPGRLGIKWVNDLLCDGRKLGGVLTAARAQQGRLTSVVFGIGLNVGVVPVTGDAPWQTPATSLRETAPGAVPTLGSFLGVLLKEICHGLELLQDQGPEAMHQAYCEGSLVIGRDILVWPETHRPEDGNQPRPRRARVLGIGPDLSLQLDTGAPPLISGRVRLAED